MKRTQCYTVHFMHASAQSDNLYEWYRMIRFDLFVLFGGSGGDGKDTFKFTKIPKDLRI